MPTIQIDIPSEAFSALHQTPDQLAREIRLAASIHWYSQGMVSQEKAAQIAGLHRIDFLNELARRKVDVIPVDMDDLKQELGLA